MKEFINFVVESLVDNPEKIDITEKEGEKSIVYELRVDQSDLGKIIGKQGRTARAIRTIMNAASVKTGKKLMLEIVE